MVIILLYLLGVYKVYSSKFGYIIYLFFWSFGKVYKIMGLIMIVVFKILFL